MMPASPSVICRAMLTAPGRSIISLSPFPRYVSLSCPGPLFAGAEKPPLRRILSAPRSLPLQEGTTAMPIRFCASIFAVLLCAPFAFAWGEAPARGEVALYGHVVSLDPAAGSPGGCPLPRPPPAALSPRCSETLSGSLTVRAAPGAGVGSPSLPPLPHAATLPTSRPFWSRYASPWRR